MFNKGMTRREMTFAVWREIYTRYNGNGVPAPTAEQAAEQAVEAVNKMEDELGPF